MISFPFLSKSVGVFIFILSHFLSLMYKPLSRVINNILVPLMLVFYYKQRVSIALQCVQAIVILQQGATLG
jgi:hypothetical protein